MVWSFGRILKPGRQRTKTLVLRQNPNQWHLNQQLAVVVLLLICGLPGCRSRVHQQVYTDKMAGEIRQLEDRLVVAEYENEVLQQQLQRQHQRMESLRDDDPRTDASGPLDASARDRDEVGSPGSGKRFSDELPPPKPLPDRQDSFDDPLGNELDIDLGEPMDADSLMQPPALDLGTPPPINPVPPRESELIPPSIDIGEPQPPGSNNGRSPKPPGQIKLPGEVRQLFPGAPLVATTVEIHRGLSGIHHADSDPNADGVYLVISVKDSKGQAFESDKPISIVMLDPARSGDAARLGRWDFTVEQVREKFKPTPLNSYHIPLTWNDNPPLGTDVAIFVRVFIDEQTKIETNAMLPLAGTREASTEWLPNAFGKQLATPGFDANSVWR